MRHLIPGLILLAAVAASTAALGAGDPPSAASPTAEVPAASAAPSPTPSLAERIKQLEAARADLAARCQTGIAQHDGAIAVLKQLQGEP